MPTYLTPFFAAIAERVVQAWPEVLPPNGGGVYHGIELATIEWERLAGEGKLPVALLDVNLNATSEWGMGNAVDTDRVNIYYVTRNNQLVDALAQKLEALRTNLWDNDVLTVGQVIAYPSVSWSMELTPNRYFLNTDKPYRAGMLSVPVLVGELVEG